MAADVLCCGTGTARATGATGSDTTAGAGLVLAGAGCLAVVVAAATGVVDTGCAVLATAGLGCALAVAPVADVSAWVTTGAVLAATGAALPDWSVLAAGRGVVT